MKTNKIEGVITHALNSILEKLEISKPSKKTKDHLKKAAKKLTKQLKHEAGKAKKKKASKPKKKSPDVVKAETKA